MYCYQCEQTAKGVACEKHGVCGKDPRSAALQDLLMHATKGIAVYAHGARQLGAVDGDIDGFVLDALFTTVTNVNFDPERLRDLVLRAKNVGDKARALYEEACAKAGKTPEDVPACPACAGEEPGFTDPVGTDLDALVALGEKVGIPQEQAALGVDVAGLAELILYGLKGLAAYAHHARILGREDDSVYAFVHEALACLAKDSLTADELVPLALRCGEVNIRVMELLDAAHTETYGHPEPTAVRVEPLKGKAILVSGHDLRDLEEILKQTEGKGINVYTHSEMLPCHAYPGLKKYGHLVGNYGGAWQDQKKEFAAFPGAIVMTTNCIQKPDPSYMDRIFTLGLVAWPGVRHIADGDFSPAIEVALAAEGFAEDGADRTITVGFGRNAVLNVAGTVVEAVKSGALRHFFLIGGCDGAKPGRNYYTEFAEAVPDDCVILTLACGKFRFNKFDFGDIAGGAGEGGIPRLLDIGQCNDAYSAIRIAVALAEAFETNINGLPLSFVLSWFEQKAVVILLSLLHLGIKDIRLGPTLPAFITPPVLQVLVDNFNIMPISTPQEDLAAMLQN